MQETIPCHPPQSRDSAEGRELLAVQGASAAVDLLPDVLARGGSDAITDIATPPISPLYPAGMSPLSPHCCQHRGVGAN